MKQTLFKIARWIMFFPCFILAYELTRFLMTQLNSYVFGEVPYVVDQPWFGGHYIGGPIFLIFRETGSLFVALMVGIYIVPNHKKKTFYIFGALWIANLIFFTGVGTVIYHPWPLEGLIRWLLFIGTHITILIMIGITFRDTPKEDFGREFLPF